MPEDRPNVLVVFTDQQRWDSLGCYGNPMEISPNLDRAAESGTRFERAISSQPVCGPARATLQTGQYATTHEVYNNGGVIQQAPHNVANVFGWMLGELGAIADGATLAPGYALLASPRLSDGAANPLFLGTGVNTATGRPERRVCCLRYRLDGFGYCRDCPVTRRHGAAAT